MTSTQAQAAPDSLPIYSITMLSHPARVAVQRDADGRVIGTECVKADGLRRKLVEGIGRELAKGRSVEELLLRALAVGDLLRGLSAVERDLVASDA